MTLQSSDAVKFRVSKDAIMSHSDGFNPPAESNLSDRDEVVNLTETSSVLHLLLQYMCPESQPDLTTIEFQDLAGLAEAAQKYTVWPAMEVSKMQMEKCIPKHGFQVLVYAATHDFKELADEAAEYSCTVSLTDALDHLNSKYLRAFSQYIDQRRSIINVLTRHCGYHSDDGGNPISCLHWEATVGQIRRELTELNGPLKNALQLLRVRGKIETPDFTLTPCSTCFRDIWIWQDQCEELLHSAQQMSAFLF